MFIKSVVAWACLALLISTPGPHLFGADPDLSLLTPAKWRYSAPLIVPEQRTDDPSHAQKDPSIVFHEGRWHVFMTAKLQGRSVTEYCSFEKWEDAHKADHTILPLCESDYYCAPQVFFFRPHQKWYLVYQVGVPGQRKMWVAYSTTETIDDPTSWTPAQPMLDGGPNDPRTVGGIDYWIICDDTTAYLFFTSNDGRMWRMHTPLDQFPHGFHNCQLALKDKIFEAAHIYKVQGMDKYLNVIEENGKRYFKAYVADRLDGEWMPLAATDQQPFASWRNIAPADGVEPWTDNVSHGELIRSANDETLLIDPKEMRFVFQGLFEREKQGLGYGKFPWRIGILTPESE
ncbi:MAG: hypothetical protein KDA80_01235 [Planctomycetaceae bacterium]|nr:hypothetical protein [Planctomycetaceae bacterium]